ncbi:hypothetical protein H1C71_040335 [Ictidomys tridecemlineatus]|nr:hypothetical protein H1C71_040335 [Ictidomys tridecemlineatus]KAG3257238.1 hypothetical protein H1C71_040335 [Ictidomys tridecemlineatus]KAG3257239.1 hypothetical protein H1C71_040335 [Ictidomys tridecemlineatus]KAG3257240.1 hypothetical protein H1C71_040335 [Ictidomys tridecemlineatus]KAG3257241.1 hypothetical protein H1C71_040335 [Ictidomys tridecemlineatus]
MGPAPQGKAELTPDSQGPSSGLPTCKQYHHCSPSSLLPTNPCPLESVCWSVPAFRIDLASGPPEPRPGPHHCTPAVAPNWSPWVSGFLTEKSLNSMKLLTLAYEATIPRLSLKPISLVPAPVTGSSVLFLKSKTLLPRAQSKALRHMPCLGGTSSL